MTQKCNTLSVERIRRVHEILAAANYRPWTDEERAELDAMAPYDVAGFLLNEMARINQALEKAWEAFSCEDWNSLGNIINTARYPEKPA